MNCNLIRLRLLVIVFVFVFGIRFFFVSYCIRVRLLNSSFGVAGPVLYEGPPCRRGLLVGGASLQAHPYQEGPPCRRGLLAGGILIRSGLLVGGASSCMSTTLFHHETVGYGTSIVRKLNGPNVQWI